MEEPVQPVNESECVNQTKVEEENQGEDNQKDGQAEKKADDIIWKVENEYQGSGDEKQVVGKDQPANQSIKEPIDPNPKDCLEEQQLPLDKEAMVPGHSELKTILKASSTVIDQQTVKPPESSADTISDISPQQSPAKDAPAHIESINTQATKQTSKGKTVWMGLDELVKWEKTIMSLDTKLKKSEAEFQGLTSRKGTLKEQIHTLAANNMAERDQLKESETKAKMNVEALEQKNKTLVDLLDKAEAGLQQNTTSKTKEIDVNREALSKLIQAKATEVDELQERYRKEHLVEKELNKLRTELDDGKKQIEKVDASIVQLRRKEAEWKRRKQAEQAEQEAHDKLNAEVVEVKRESVLLDQELAGLRLDASQHTAVTLRLSAQVEELQQREKLHESELEGETKLTRDEIVAYKKSAAAKEVKLKELERAHEELRKQAISKEAEVAAIASQLRAIHSGMQRPTQMQKRSDKSDRRLIESLIADKTQLKTDVDKLSRETGRLQVIIRDLEENITSREANIELLLARFSELEMIDKVLATKELQSEQRILSGEVLHRLSDTDLKRLMERVILQNIYLMKSTATLKRPTF